jgi:hypothetical protein
VSFVNASFARTVVFTSSVFKTDANFYGMKVGYDAFFSNTVFEGTADFVVANILRSFYADEAQFNNKEKNCQLRSYESWLRGIFFENPF